MPSSAASARRRPGFIPPAHRVLAICFSVLALVVVGGAAFASVRLTRTPPPPRLQFGLPADLPLAPGHAPAIPVPTTGSFDLVSSDLGRLAVLAPNAVVPIGSVAKVMTALVVLQQRPLTGLGSGPTYTITSQDVSLYNQVVAADGSNLAVTVGEQFTERQLLLALLLPSADNIADTLAAWVAGSQAGFLAELNAEAKTLGMTQTTFADASGLSPQTVSTAADLVKLGQAAIGNPVLAGLVASQTARMPDGTTVHNLDTDLGSVPGWLGIKTGSTSQAGGCLLFAAEHAAPVGDGAEVQLTGAILGQVTAGETLDQELADALNSAAAAVKAAFQDYATVAPRALPAPSLSGAVTSPWGTSAGLQATLQSGSPPIVVRLGALLRLSGSEVPHLDPTSVTAGTVVGHVTGRLGSTTIATWSVAATYDLGTPTWEWLLTH